jgi:hypothetical protein
MPEILSLEEISPAQWVAKYRGNYGVYTVRLRMNASGAPRDSSCTCPSHEDPCKHIDIIAAAICAQTNQEKTAPKHSGLPKPEDVLSEISESELRQFFLSQLKENKVLRQNFYFKFAEKHRTPDNENPYSKILRKFFKTFSVSIDADDFYYSDETSSIDILDEWKEEIKKLIEGEEYEKAILICKAWIEEFSEWFSDQGQEDQENVDDSYAKTPFEFLSEISKTEHVNHAELYAYCKNEMNAPKYDEGNMRENFHAVLLELAKKTGNEEFITLQDKLLENSTSLQERDLEKILRRKIDFYYATKQPSRADEIINTNLHIEKFREIAVEKLISSGKLSEAEALINKYAPQNPRRYFGGIDWNEKLLRIAQKENNIPKIREVSFRYITDGFAEKHYQIYKSTFRADEWLQERERLLAHYRTKGGQVGGFVSTFYSTDSVAEFLLAESLSDRLLVHLTKNPSPNALEKYHTFLGKHYPEETLALFRKIVDDYTEKNVGQKHYEDIVRWLRQMRKIPSGAAVVSTMSANYRLQYKRRTALMRELDNL